MKAFKSTPTVLSRGMFIGIALLVSAWQGPPAVAQDNVDKAIDAKFSKYDGKLPLWAIQPGTAPRMIDMTIYFNNMWFGAQAGNWDLARFEVYRTEEAIKGIYVVRPKRIDTVKPWAESALPALIKAIEAKDKKGFEKAYDNAIAGCNGCHAGSGGGPLKSMASFKIIRPTTPLFSNIDFKKR
ncbi:MAG: hypothetical protein HYU44_16820 [Betaproteobacteria bacterium]|nr:hypothetical protein [Betaproteobacteria bacterium]MBI2289838.1 hypothetical protein [Betaproteobacteria bacterium]MBI3057423.1 hypothetical protein [Betaproteobacteria bacterium]